MRKGGIKKEKEKVHVHVFVTRNRRFRAKITEGKYTYQVTVGGKNWVSGLGKEYEKEIRRKAEILVAHLESGLAIFSDNYPE